MMNSDFISPRFFEVMCKYCFKVVTGQILVFSIYFGNFSSPLQNLRFEVFSKSPILIMRQVSSIVIFLMSINNSISRPHNIANNVANNVNAERFQYPLN